MYSVNYWGSHPDEDNDDCWTGKDFDTLEAAMAAFNAKPSEVIPHKPGRLSLDLEAAYIQIDGPDVNQIRKNPIHNPQPDDDNDDDWKRECAMQAGMGLGIDAYNDEMGF